MELKEKKNQEDANIVSYTQDEIKEQIKKEGSKTDWKRLENMTDEQIEEAVKSDQDAAPILTKEDLKNGLWIALKKPIPKDVTKEKITINIDSDILTFFKGLGKGYQSKINALLRSCMESMTKDIDN